MIFNPDTDPTSPIDVILDILAEAHRNPDLDPYQPDDHTA